MPPGTMATGCELYVYYRVARADTDEAHAQVEAAQARLRTALPGLEARLLRRSDDAGKNASGDTGRDPTWMEIYRLEAGLDDADCAQIDAAMRDWPAARVGARTIERFVPIDGAVAAPLS